MNLQLLSIDWQNRAVPLIPCAVAGFGTAAFYLAEKLLSFEDEKLKKFQGVSAGQMILLTGSEEDLPWANGVIYLGRDAPTPSALFPTTIEPQMAPDLFETILKKKFGELIPCAVLPGKIIPYAEAKTISREILQKWLAEKR